MNDPMYRDSGEFKTNKDRKVKNSREYECWQHMRARCYKDTKNYPGYVGCTVSEEFHSFQSFAAWAVLQIGFSTGFQLDKDLLSKGNRVYSARYCVFLPHEINSALIRHRKNRGDLPIGVRMVSGQRLRPFRASMSRGQKCFPLGSHQTPEQAFVAYKTAKEEYIKELASKYKDAIDPRAYAALMDYTVEITD